MNHKTNMYHSYLTIKIYPGPITVRDRSHWFHQEFICLFWKSIMIMPLEWLHTRMFFVMWFHYVCTSVVCNGFRTRPLSRCEGTELKNIPKVNTVSLSGTTITWKGMLRVMPKKKHFKQWRGTTHKNTYTPLFLLLYCTACTVLLCIYSEGRKVPTLLIRSKTVFHFFKEYKTDPNGSKILRSNANKQLLCFNANFLDNDALGVGGACKLDQITLEAGN